MLCKGTWLTSQRLSAGGFYLLGGIGKWRNGKVSQAHWEWVKTYVHGKIVAWREDNAVSDCAAETAARGFDWQLFLHRSILI